MGRVSACWVALVIITVVAPPRVNAQPAPNAIVTVPVTSYELDDPAGSLSIPIEPSAGVTLEASVAVLEVRYESRPDPVVLHKLSARLEENAKRWSLVVTTPPDAMPNVGSYNVTVIVAGSRDNQRVDQRVVIQLVRPAAQVTTSPSRIILQQTDYIVFSGSPAPDSFVVEEASGVRGLDLEAHDTREAKSGNDVAASHLEVDNIPRIRPGGAEVVQLSIQGDVPRGTTTGELELRAPQLAKPVRVTYELRTRYSAIIVILVLGIGLALGWLLRTGLQKKAEADRMRAEIGKIAVAAMQARSTATDGLFQADLATIIHDCEEAMHNAKPADLKSLHDKEKDALDTAVKKLNDARTNAESWLAAWTKALHGDWSLPPDAAAALEAMRGAADQATILLDRVDVQNATRTLADSAGVCAKALSAAITGFRQRVGVVVSELDASLGAISWPQPLATAAHETSDALKSRAAALLDQVPADPELVNNLQKLHEAVEELRADARRCEATRGAVLDAMSAELHRLGVPQASIDELVGSVPAADAAEDYLRQLAAGAKDLAGRFQAILDALATSDAITSAFRAGAWTTAIDEARKELHASAPERKPAGADAATAPVKQLLLETNALPAALFARRKAPSPDIALPKRPNPQVAVAIAKAEKRSARADIIGSAISLVLLVLAYSTYIAAQPIATPAALVGVFFQALTIDVTVGAVIGAGKSMFPAKPAA